MLFRLGLAIPLALLAAGQSGLTPRPDPADYPARETGDAVTIGAAVLTPDQVKAVFAADLHEYVVIETGVYPASGGPLELSSADFALRVGTRDEMVRAANPRAMAAANQQKNAPASKRSDVNVYTGGTVGYESGGYDSTTGRRRSGVYTGTEVGVGVGDPGYPQPPRTGSSDRDRDLLERDLTARMLPAGTITAPAAGYLYFRLPSKARNSALELRYLSSSGKVRVLLAPAHTK